MHQAQAEITINTHGQGLVEFTREAADFVRAAGLKPGC